ncbi:membrane protein [Thioclava dalianensis]|uniref:Membrane protein n=1 Tax=Thioclava dalianensis TaxID=1185766 RepID=A0A074TRN8_9RHOB|nr:DUF475 domain-containing protein [Thioclava dalianensis]KEP71633.1 membrane protein [Thioclava dalianensis]SFN42547.1 hypothetical protein SAMN05216224_105168 [Thioclava dalianensis]
MKIAMHYFRWAFGVTVLGLVAAFALGASFAGSWEGAVGFLLIATILAVLEISLSFDNAIVNANTLKRMTPKWQRRFLTWGILIAVFGMRVLFPLLIVVIAAGLGPWEALELAARDPQRYAHIIEGAHLSIAGFGGAFLMMVALRFFIDAGKEDDWIGGIEPALRRLGRLRFVQIPIVGLVIAAFALIVPEAERRTFLVATLSGLGVFLCVEGLGHVFDRISVAQAAGRAGLGAFLYLEVLDASFSFDGVVGAFALTQNLFLIAIGLGVGAMYVRSMTIMLVERQTLTEFRYLEHGAFWSILLLSLVMFAQTLIHVPEAVTGLLGAGMIGAALVASLRDRRKNRALVHET